MKTRKLFAATALAGLLSGALLVPPLAWAGPVFPWGHARSIVFPWSLMSGAWVVRGPDQRVAVLFEISEAQDVTGRHQLTVRELAPQSRALLAEGKVTQTSWEQAAVPVLLVTPHGQTQLVTLALYEADDSTQRALVISVKSQESLGAERPFILERL